MAFPCKEKLRALKRCRSSKNCQRHRHLARKKGWQPHNHWQMWELHLGLSDPVQRVKCTFHLRIPGGNKNGEPSECCDGEGCKFLSAKSCSGTEARAGARLSAAPIKRQLGALPGGDSPAPTHVLQSWRWEGSRNAYSTVVGAHTLLRSTTQGPSL